MPRAVPPRRRVGVLYFGSAAALAAAVVLFSVGMGSYVSATRRVEHTVEVRRQVYEWLATLLDGETGARGYIATADTAFLQPYESAVARERTEAAALQNLVADDPSQAQRVAAAARVGQAVMHGLREVVTLVRSGHRDEAIAQLASGQSLPAMDELREDTQDILAEEERLLAGRSALVSSRGTLTLAVAVVLMLMAAGLLVLGWTRERTHDATATILATQARWRLKTLSESAGALAEASTLTDVSRVIVDQSVRIAAADTCTLYLLSEAGDRGAHPAHHEDLGKYRHLQGAGVG
jgi:CHASE3 domain sensor protein